MEQQSFGSVISKSANGRTYISLPFEPDRQWGSKPVHHLAGTVDDTDVRGTVEQFGEGVGIAVGPTWLRDRGFHVGDRVVVTLWPEGIQRDALAPDLQAALSVVPAAGVFFDGLAQFYRTAYVRWIDATNGKPDIRAERIETVVALLADKKKERPR